MLENQPIDCFIGNNISRVGDDKLLNGKGQFGSDTPFKPNALHAVVLRSEHASAKIKKIDFSKAKNSKVFTVLLLEKILVKFQTHFCL